MKSLVVGAGGFLGSAIARALSARGDDVWGVVGSAPSGNEIAVYSPGEYARLANRLANTSLIVYAAGRTLPRDPSSDEQAHRTDLAPLAELLEALARAPRPRTFVLLSSGGGIYGETPDGGLLEETTPPRPVSVYGRCRLAMEERLLVRAAEAGLRPFILRASNVYGPGQRLGGGSTFILRALLAAAGSQGPLPLMGDGRQRKDFLYLDDLLDAVLAVPLDRPNESSDGADPRFNIARGESHGLMEVLAAIERVTGRAVPIEPMASATDDVRQVELGVEKARRELGWAARVGLEEGISRFWRALADGNEPEENRA